MTGLRVLSAALVLVVLGAAGFAAASWHPALPENSPPSPASFDPTLVKRGRTLAAIGDCGACHTAPDQPAFSGGVPVDTPFGTIYGSNITPDTETGLGRWSEAAFRRAMREGIDRAGRPLYPAFPYNHFTAVTDEDLSALYAYLMTREPARRTVPADTLPFPFNIRASVAVWNLLFFRPGPFRPAAGQSEAWNRGAYLVEGLGHCGACHTPHNRLGAEDTSRHLGGGTAEGWNAYALDSGSPAPVPWTVDALAFYLRHGWQEAHGVSRGPMAVVTANLASLSEADAKAMAIYLVSLMGQPSPERLARARQLKADRPRALPAASAGSEVAVPAASDEGAAIYAGACAACHESGRPVPYGGLDLRLSSALHAPDPSNLVVVTLHGLPASPGEAGPIMPGFDGTLTDAQLATLLAYLRQAIAGEAPWPDLQGTVRGVRARAVTLHAGEGLSAAPANTDIRVAP